MAPFTLQEESEPSAFVASFAGSHRHIADYLSEQVLARQSGTMRRFLLCTSILDRMSGPLCDAVLGTSGSQAVLEKLERSNLFVVPLDQSRQWYRYHRLFGQMLQAELARTEPNLAPTLRRRASKWLAEEGWVEEAVDQTLTARDHVHSSELIGRHWLDLFNSGRIETVRSWLDRMGTEAITEHPAAALTAGWIAALHGEPEAMDRWLAVAGSGPADDQRPGLSAPLESGVAIVRGLFGYCGLDARRACLARALELEPAGSGWRPFVLWGLGHVALLSGDPTQRTATDRRRDCHPATASLPDVTQRDR